MGMEEKMEKLEYALDPLEHSANGSNDNVLLAICESSQSSQDMITNDGIKYEIRDTEGVLQYRFLNSVGEQPNNASNGFASAPAPGNPEGNLQNCQIYVVNDITASRPCLISPKVITENPSDCTRHLMPGSNVSRKRDERRRATHNEVERRRRDKINQWIFKLKNLLPDNTDPKNKNSSGDSKGEILSKACEHIKNMNEDLQSLSKCLKENENLRSENLLLRELNDKLRKENQQLRERLGDPDVKVEDDLDLDHHQVS